MRISQKVILIVTASILLTAVPGVALLYSYMQRNVLATESSELEFRVATIAKSFEQRFSQSEPKLKSLARLLEMELAEPIKPKEIEAFYKNMERDQDGVWRSRRASFDGKKEAGVFLPKNPHESDEQKIQHLRIKHVMDSFGAAASKPSENVWYLSLDRSEVIFDRALPDFVFEQKYDNDYTQTPWVTYTSPQLNPNREVKFTPPLFDPVPKVWMVSALYPLYVNNQWIGSLGEDMPLTAALESMFSISQRFSGTQHMLLDAQGNYVLAGPWQKQLESSLEAYRPDLTNSPKLSALLKSQLTSTPHMLGDDVMMQGKRYMVIGVQLHPLDWRYFRMVPIEELMAPSQLLLYTLGVMVLLITVITGGVIGIAMGSSITRRIQQLSSAMQAYATDRRHRISEKLEGNDEISQATRVFNEMADDIDLGVAAREESEQRLKSAEELWRLAIEGAGDGVWDWDVAINQVRFSKRWKEIIGFAENELKNSFEEFENRLHPEDRERVLAKVQSYFEQNTPTYAIEFRMQCKDGSYKWILARGIAASRDDKGLPQRMVGTHTDITERKSIEQQLRISATAFESQEGMIVTDANRIILQVNHAFSAITGYSAEEAVGQTPKILNSGRQDKTFFESMWACINKTGAWEGEIWNRRKNGEIYPEHLTITAVKDVSGIVTNYVATLTDITLSKAASVEIENLAFYDPLTQLPNRRLLMDRLKQALAASARSNQRGALLFLDLDHFKALNDTLGHDVGDLLLKQVAERLVSCVREGDTVARLGGDEFVVLLEDLSEDALEAAKQTETIAEKIMLSLNKTFILGRHEHRSTPSVGATLFHNHDIEVDVLLKQADIAMYQAKDSGRNALRFFDPKMQEVISSRVELEHELRIAIEQQQFELYYQIQVDNTNSAIGAEALIRWQHPERGMISPFHFIQLAEETGLILPIGKWVLDMACAQLKLWQHNPLTRNLVLSVNVSAKQFFQVDFVEQVQAAILRHEVSPKLLKLELTESMLIENINDIVVKMDKLSKMGVHFSLDDFGTGYSSLQYLKKLPLNQLKIDQSFVRDIVTDPSDRAIVHTIITMARGLKLEVIAEGVELDSQLAYLGNYGCNHYQGYLFSKPVPIDEFEALLKKNLN